MTPNNSKRSRILLIALGALIPFCLFPLITIMASSGGNDEILPFLFVCLPVILIGGGLLIWFGIRKFSHSRLGQPEVFISKDELRVGETFNVQFMHTFARNITLEQILIQLVYQEKATYQQGTDTRTVTYEDVIEENELPAGDFRAGQMVSQDYDMRIPPDGMHTLKVRRNQIQWFVRIKAGIPKLPDYVKNYELTVIPELASEEDF